MQTETWAERVTDRLAALKLTRCTFEAAWSIVLLENPVDWRRDFGIRGEVYTATFDGILEEQATLQWLEGVFRAAWCSDPATAKLRHLELPAQARERTVVGPGGAGKSRLPMAA